ncbi:winged helix-turn-helix domain-containing protein [Streptomyces sp. NBC_00102]|uniref:winged helix-turn-helix domain-containing protein n=1 Tax=Streptomyces sp. NBC_00102 TaxID=2975652 RepID=UPI0022592EEE|nr:winged helix-turn-helix domain-containing protein [Streptomyces sp. NBC_00102]MCX5396415.1 winged helix-turn-helix domain-containing protein [Streptomyces sp. NBC_00102]
MEVPREDAGEPLPDHPLRLALLDLLAEKGTLTSTEAASRLGHSSGLCSFHLRQLARHGLIEEVPDSHGRAKPWRLRWGSGEQPRRPGGDGAARGRAVPGRGPAGTPVPEPFGVLSRGLEGESYRHWLARRDEAPVPWRGDPSFSAVVHLTPEEAAEVAAFVTRLLAGYRERDRDPATRPEGALPVAVVTRLFPLLPEGGPDA